MVIKGVNSVDIGGPLSGLRNIIGGNHGAGIVIGGQNQMTLYNKVVNNLIGTDENNTPDLGNDGDGVLITEDAKLNEIGGATPNSGNVIANNGGAGVALDPTAGHCNVIDPNAIFGNAGQGIDHGRDGWTPNDPGDADEGPNRLQNYPEFSSATIDTIGNLILRFKVDSAPANANYGANGLYIEFFKADASLQGESFIGSTHYTVADYNGGDTWPRNL